MSEYAPVSTDIAERLLREYGYPEARQKALAARNEYERGSQFYNVYDFAAREVLRLHEEGPEDRP